MHGNGQCRGEISTNYTIGPLILIHNKFSVWKSTHLSKGPEKMGSCLRRRKKENRRFRIHERIDMWLYTKTSKHLVTKPISLSLSISSLLCSGYCLFPTRRVSSLFSLRFWFSPTQCSHLSHTTAWFWICFMGFIFDWLIFIGVLSVFVIDLEIFNFQSFAVWLRFCHCFFFFIFRSTSGFGSF